MPLAPRLYLLTKLTGSVGIRRELRDLQTSYPDQFTLYILGLDSLMNRRATSDLSYYGIAGMSMSNGMMKFEHAAEY